MVTQVKFSENIPDGRQYFRLYQSTGLNKNNNISEEMLLDAVQHSWYIVNAYIGERLVGSCRVLSDGCLHAFITEMMVDPIFRHKSIATRMLEKVMTRCRNAKIKSIQAIATLSSFDFFKKAGFVPLGDKNQGMEFAP